jgi:uncharacterized protein (DUF952 family)
VQIFHIAEVAYWAEAQRTGSYTWSTIGRTLDEEGFLHAARGDQWDDVRRRYYTGVIEPLVLLVIETDKLTAPWQEDSVGDTTYPHIYGPLNPDAVVATVPLDAGEGVTTPGSVAENPESGVEAAAGRTFSQEFLGEMSFRMIAGVAVMGFALVCAMIGVVAAGDAGGLVGILAGLAVGIVAALAVARRRDQRLRSR